MWYTAHVIMYFKFKEGNQDSFTVWENVFLVELPPPIRPSRKRRGWVAPTRATAAAASPWATGR
jgi:hypothetical protein